MPNPPNMMAATDLVWPVTYRFVVGTPYGIANLTYSVDVPHLENDLDGTSLMQGTLWQACIAPAMSQACVALSGTSHAWRRGGGGAPWQFTYAGGMLFSLPAPRKHTPCAVLFTGHDDRWGRRRIWFPGAPAGWISDEQLNDTGAGMLRSLLAGMHAGWSAFVPPALTGWLVMFPDALEGPLPGLRAPGFRYVTHTRLCSYPTRFPDGTL